MLVRVPPEPAGANAIAEIHALTSRPRKYEWIVEADIAACFDEIDHVALMDRVRIRIKDKKVLTLVKAFLKSGVMTRTGDRKDTPTGTPPGGILSPLLANIALSVLDEHYARAWTAMGDGNQRHRRRKRGEATYRLIRYADDSVLVKGERHHALALLDEVAQVIARLGLRPAPDKTRVVHIDEGFDFLGHTIIRMVKRGTSKTYVFTFPSTKAMRSMRDRTRELIKNSSTLYVDLDELLLRVNKIAAGLFEVRNRELDRIGPRPRESLLAVTLRALRMAGCAPEDRADFPARNLDPRRVKYYQYVMHLDLVGGPLRIAEGDFPNRKWMLDDANFHLQKALAYKT